MVVVFGTKTTLALGYTLFFREPFRKSLYYKNLTFGRLLAPYAIHRVRRTLWWVCVPEFPGKVGLGGEKNGKMVSGWVKKGHLCCHYSFVTI
jgi:hypothetical protein